MELEELNKKWKKKLRPDLKFPTHIKRKIYHIYQNEIFNDADKVICGLIYKELIKTENLKNFVDIKEIKLGDYRKDDEEWFLPISKNWVCGPRLRDIITKANILQ